MANIGRKNESLIIVSFTDPTRYGNRKDGKDSGYQGKILSFTKEKTELKEQPDTETKDPIDIYLDKLPKKKTDKKPLISWLEYAKLQKAISGLRRLIPAVETSTILSIMSEYDIDEDNTKPTVDEIAWAEESTWQEALDEGEELIPGFNFQEAHQHFIQPPEERRPRVHFISKDFDRPIDPPAVPFKLVKGEMYFFIVLKMYRLQYGKNLAANPQSTAQN